MRSPTIAARPAYGGGATPVRTPRGVEYALFARITGRLQRAWPARGDNFAELAGAVTDNLRLWTTLAADVAGERNGLPAPLRAGLFALYEFTAAHSRKVLGGSGDIAVLVDINTAVMRGLRGAGSA